MEMAPTAVVITAIEIRNCSLPGIDSTWSTSSGHFSLQVWTGKLQVEDSSEVLRMP